MHKPPLKPTQKKNEKIDAPHNNNINVRKMEEIVEKWREKKDEQQQQQQKLDQCAENSPNDTHNRNDLGPTDDNVAEEMSHHHYYSI